MTISSTIRTAGPFTGNGTVATFSFPFRVFAASDVAVLQTAISTNVTTTLTLTTNYTVALNANQDTNPGGSITLVGGNLASGQRLLIRSAIPETQPILITNQSGFYPEVINDGLDRATAQVQQVGAVQDRSIRVPTEEVGGAGLVLPPVSQRANQSLGFDSNGNILVGGTFSSLLYYGAASTAPTTRPDGSARQAGDLYYNSSALQMNVFTGSAWSALSAGATDGNKGAITITGGGGVWALTPSTSAPTDFSLSSFRETVSAIGTVGATHTLVISSATLLTATLTASTATTFTMPSASAGRAFTLFLKQAAAPAGGTATFTGVKWNAATPTMSATAGRMDIFGFVSDGTNWYGSVIQNFTP